MNIKILLVLFALLFSGCTFSKPSLSDAETEILSELSFDKTIMLEVKSFGTSLKRMQGVTDDYDEVPANGVILTVRPNSGRNTVFKIREKLAGTPYWAFLHDNKHGYGDDEIAIVEGSDAYSYLAIVRTDGVNLDLSHEQVVARYKEWDQKYGLLLVGAGQDWLEAEFKNPPNDWNAFAKEVFDFCPDVVEQGTGDIDTLAKEMRNQNSVFLWWD